MKHRAGDKVQVVRLLDPYTDAKYLWRIGRVIHVGKFGYRVLLEGMLEHEEEAQFMEGELEAV